MHGFVFVTWERYLADRFGPRLLEDYRAVLGETGKNTPLMDRRYDDATLLVGLETAVRLTAWPADALLHEYGRYFLLNGLTRRLCSSLLNQVQSGLDLLLVMRNAHAQIGSAAGITPPLFRYEQTPGDPDGLVLLYDSPRKLCSLLQGSIEGAARRYGQTVEIQEPRCMKRGDAACRFVVHFQSAQRPPLESPELQERQMMQQKLADLVYSFLPEQEQDGLTLNQLRDQLRYQSVSMQALRPYLLLQALEQLHMVGWVASTAYRAGDTLETRRYWRVPPVED
jgi:hypothetical protein